MLKYLLISLIFFAGQFECVTQQLIMKWSNPVNLVTLNSKYNDFAPEFNQFDSLLYFNSDRFGGQSYFFYSSIIDSNNFSAPLKVKGELNDGKDNVSYATFYREDKAYISSFRMLGDRPYFNLFETIKTRDGWSAPISVAELAGDVNILQPSISPDGKMLAFVSDQKSPDKNTDIYICYKNQLGIWSEPEFMSVLNTDDKEITPKFHTNDTLYFASDGQSGPGGFDIYFSTRRNDGSWTKPNPLNDINTSFDESDFTILPGNRAIFASNRPGGKGGYDLFLTSYYWVENKIPPERNLEISIATQIVNIKTMSDFTYEFTTLPNAILSDITPETLKLMMTKHDTAFEFSGKTDIDYYACINELGLRLQKYKDSKLIINYIILESENKDVKLPNSYELAVKISNYFESQWGIPASNIEITKNVLKVSGSELLSFPVIYFDSDNPKIFSPIEAGNRIISTDPPFSDVFIKIKPPETFASSSSHVTIGNKKLIFSKYTDNPVDQFTIPLNDNSADLSRTDSLFITVFGVNKFNDTITKSLQFDITHSESMKRKQITIDKRNYEQIYLFVPKLDGEKIPVYLKEIVGVISESAAFTKSIKVQFYSLLAQQKAINILNILKKAINLPALRLELEQVPYENDSVFSRKFAPYVIRLLLEKP